MAQTFNPAVTTFCRVLEGFRGSEDKKVIQVKRGLQVLRVPQAELLEKEDQRGPLGRQVSLVNLEFLEYQDEPENWERSANLEKG